VPHAEHTKVVWECKRWAKRKCRTLSIPRWYGNVKDGQKGNAAR